MNKQKGFTLVEIAIVLVIIGLLLGGVLKGQELINNAKVKRVNNDFNGISAAIYSYFERYNALPGDDAKAKIRWADATEGTGDGIIGGAWSSATVGDESRKMWDHMRRAGLISGSETSQPMSAFGGRVGVQSAAIFGVAGPVICVENIIGKYAQIIDTQLDDGVCTTGLLRGGTGAAPGTVCDADYAQDTTYILCKQM